MGSRTNPGSQRLHEREPNDQRTTAKRVWLSRSLQSKHQTLRGQTQIPVRSAETFPGLAELCSQTWVVFL